MKDGIYRITLKVDGQDVIAEAQIRGGVFQGLGQLAGIVGVFSTGQPPRASSTPASDVPERGIGRGISWERAPLPASAPPWLAIDSSDLETEARFGGVASNVHCLRSAVGTIQRNARRHPASSQFRQSARATRNARWTFGEWDSWTDEGPQRAA